MTQELIKTDNYLLAVDDAEINVGDWFYDDARQVRKAVMGDGLYWAVRNGYKRILAHLPLNNAPILEGLPLLPPIENEAETLAFRHTNPLTDYLSAKEFNCMKEGFKSGYNQAREKYKFTEEDMKRCFEVGQKHGSLYKGNNFYRFIQSLSQPKTPTHFEFEMKCGRCYSTEPDNDCWSAKECSRGYDFDDIILTTTNAQGQEIACGKYIYE